jgi:hypothetical protein
MIKPKQVPKVNTRLWASMVNYRLSHGYGVEDIGLAMRCHPDVIRFHVRALRANGELQAIYDKMRYRMRYAA